MTITAGAEGFHSRRLGGHVEAVAVCTHWVVVMLRRLLNSYR